MKLRDLPRAFQRHRAPKRYPHAVTTFTLPIDGTVDLAQWQHPGEKPTHVDQNEVTVLRRFLSNGDAAIDIGAHTGDSTVPMALAVGRPGVVFALEPNPYVFDVLQTTARLNPDRTHIVPLMFAATPEDGEFEFCYSDDGFCNGGAHRWQDRWRHGHFSRLRVQGRNLDAYLRTHHAAERARIRYVKIDTEGFDRQVVRSLGPLIELTRPFIRAEFFKHLPADERYGFFDDLHRAGYRVFRWTPAADQSEELSREDVVRRRHFDVFAVPRERT